MVSSTPLSGHSAESAEFGTNVGEQILAATHQQNFEAERRWAPCNLGHTEQKIRIATGVTLLAAAAFAPLPRGWRIGLGVFGASQLVTGTVRYCPLWQALGVDTREDR